MSLIMTDVCVGFMVRDVTSEAIVPLLDERINGFVEVCRGLCYKITAPYPYDCGRWPEWQTGDAFSACPVPKQCAPKRGLS